MKMYFIDLFSGAGGTTTGIHMADGNIEVIACVNHDENAIKSHAANHPDCIHYIEDVRDLKVVEKLKKLCNAKRKQEPDCSINIWASLECTNYSKAKGGQPRDADSRTLAYALYNYIEALRPDYLMIENVREFMAWGPLDEKGRPISMKNGSDYLAWLNKVKSYGYWHDHRLLNSADFGAYTSRERYFGVFAKKGLPISWPTQTHAKNPDTMFDDYLKPWKAVKDVLDLQDEGKSIFDRKKPLVEATLKRIYAGLIKFVANGDTAYLQKYYSGRPAGKVISVDGPAGSLTCVANQAVMTVERFLQRYNGGSPVDKVKSIDGPIGVIPTANRHALVKLQYLQSYYGNGGVHSADEPCPTVTTKDRFSKITPQFFVNYYSTGGINTSLDKPCPTITGIPKQRLTTVCYVDKARMAIAVYPTDSPTMIKIKEFMAIYGLCDIKQRMLNISELLRIQGFPENYILVGTQTEQKKYIGNAVVTIVAKALVDGIYSALIKYIKEAA